jgi:hypothetical protein
MFMLYCDWKKSALKSRGIIFVVTKVWISQSVVVYWKHAGLIQLWRYPEWEDRYLSTLISFCPISFCVRFLLILSRCREYGFRLSCLWLPLCNRWAWVHRIFARKRWAGHQQIRGTFITVYVRWTAFSERRTWLTRNGMALLGKSEGGSDMYRHCSSPRWGISINDSGYRARSAYKLLHLGKTKVGPLPRWDDAH